jgi:hypothetical protein
MSASLEDILKSMIRKVEAGKRSEPEQFHVATHKLARGLTLSLELSDGRYTLTLSRVGINPSADEIRVCSEALQIDDGDGARLRLGRYYRKGGSPIIYAARLWWPRLKQSTLLEKNNGS